MLGSNVPTIGGLSTGFKFGDKWKCECIQIYLTLSRRWDVPNLTKEEITKFKEVWSKSSVKEIIAHIPFLVNLATPNKIHWRNSIERLMTEISRASKLGVSHLILHPGSHLNLSKQYGIKQILKALNIVAEKNKNHSTKILLETMSGQGNMIGSSFKEISYILKKVKKPDFFGVCFDTAHVFMAGYDIRGYKGYERVLQKFDNLIGIDKIKAIHLNDSKTDLGSKVDRHACIGEGKMGMQVFHAILKDKRFFNIPKILEIPERDKKSKDCLEMLYKLQKIPIPIYEPKNFLVQLTLSEIY